MNGQPRRTDPHSSALVGLHTLKGYLGGSSLPRLARSRVLWGVAGAIVLALIPAALVPTWGQAPTPLSLDKKLETFFTPRSSDKSSAEIATGPVRLDGRKLFLIAAAAVGDEEQNSLTPIEERTEDIEERLNQIASSDFNPATLQVSVEIDPISNLPVISVNGQYLMTVTSLDAELQGGGPARRAADLTQIVKIALNRAKQERQLEFLQRQGILAGGITLLIITGSSSIVHWQRHLKAQRENILAQLPASTPSPVAVSPAANPVNLEAVQEQMTLRQQRNLIALQRRLLQVGQLAIWGGGAFVILGLFPYSRWLQPLILLGLGAPLKVLGIVLGTSVAVRITAVLVDRFFQALQEGEFLSPRASQRLALRVSTFSLVLKRTLGIGFVGIGTLVSLATVGVNVGPLLAGAGIIGLAISFASQNVIKDIINGFFILLDDQYAVGDVIVVGEVGGFVENMNLRITQLRNDEGRLITIPNSQVTIVENLSKDWSRVDLKIYVAYDTNVHQAFKVLEQVGLEMLQEPVWRKSILESPEVLGVDELKNTGIMIRVWIKTQPLQQWNVAREYRSRLKLAFDQAEISIGIPQQSVKITHLNSNSQVDSAWQKEQKPTDPVGK